eukprot:6128007-Alexandrium_andersonii.AAC.1
MACGMQGCGLGRGAPDTATAHSDEQLLAHALLWFPGAGLISYVVGSASRGVPRSAWQPLGGQKLASNGLA